MKLGRKRMGMHVRRRQGRFRNPIPPPNPPPRWLNTGKSVPPDSHIRQIDADSLPERPITQGEKDLHIPDGVGVLGEFFGLKLRLSLSAKPPSLTLGYLVRQARSTAEQTPHQI